MENTYRVAIHFNEDIGYVEYLSDMKKINVVIDNAEAKAKAEAYFAQEHEISVPHDTLMDFTKRVIIPASSIDDFKLAMTRLWGATDIYVDWSRPIKA